jgi:hypothetical protein
VTKEKTMDHELEHPDFYSAGESVRRAALLIRGGWRTVHGKDTRKVDRALERLAEEARKREAAAKKK